MWIIFRTCGRNKITKGTSQLLSWRRERLGQTMDKMVRVVVESDKTTGYSVRMMIDLLFSLLLMVRPLFKLNCTS
jgi:hypothetical protein